jgi:regulator of sigma E protease
MFDFLLLAANDAAFLHRAAAAVLTVIGIVFLFSLTVFVHEFGHYWVAKKLGFKIETFSVGFGPALWKWVSPRSGITYKFAAIPLGGYVALPQMDPVLDRRRREALAAGKTPPPPPVEPWKRLLVALAGGAMNMVLAFALATVIWKVGVKRSPLQTEPEVGYVEEGSAVHALDIRPGDRFLSINDRKLRTWEDFFTEVALNPTVRAVVSRDGTERELELPTTQEGSGLHVVAGMGPRTPTLIEQVFPDTPAAAAGLRAGESIVSADGAPIFSNVQFTDLLSARGEKPLALGLSAPDGTTREVTVTPHFDPERGRHLVGIQFNVEVIHHPTPAAQITHFAGAVFRILKAFGRSEERGRAFDNIGGPVAIFTAWYTILENSLAKAIWFTALLNVNLAIMNLLPILILDGGHVLIALYEMLFRRAPNERMLNALTQVAFFLLMSLVVFITIRDAGRVKYYRGHVDEPDPPAAVTNAPPAALPAATP